MFRHLSFFIVYILSTSVYSALSAFAPSLRIPGKTIVNKISEIRSICDSQNVNITVEMKQPFKGIIFAKDFAQECKVLGSSLNSLKLSLPTFGCGVRLTSSTDENGNPHMFFTVGLIIQQDRYLRQISDQETIVNCEVESDAFLVKSSSLFNALKNEIRTKDVNHRIGRVLDQGWSKDLSEKELEEELEEALSAARAWMEITPENNNNRSDTVEVGETILLTVKSTLPAGIGWRIVDCLAHDGLEDSSQKLLDGYGCPIDEGILPIPKFGPIRSIASMRHQEAVSKFAAFKFPDRDRLHIQCKLKIYRGSCDKINCSNMNETSENRIGRSKNDNEEVLDRLEVYNSVEVIAPEIDNANESRKKVQSTDFDTYSFLDIPEDRTLCVSVDKIAIAFCILGIIFLLAVTVTICSLLKTRRSPRGIHYSRSLSSSRSSGSAYGSKLLLHDSPTLSQYSSSASNRMQFGRIL